MRRITLTLVTAFVCSIATYGCASQILPDEEHVTSDQAFALYAAEGLSCATKDAILTLDAQGLDAFSVQTREHFSIEDIHRISSEEESGCEQPTPSTQQDPNKEGVGVITAAITSTWTGESIEELSFGGGNVGASDFRDSSTYSWMCNSGNPESPADIIVQVNVTGAYNNRSGLRVTGTNGCGTCAIPGALSSRVYSDNDIRSCVGYWTAVGCCGSGFDKTDVRYGLF